MRKRHRLRSPQRGQSVVLPLEPLEGRVLLATAREIFSVGNIDTSDPTSTVITDTKNGPMSNVGANLLSLYLDYRRFRKAGGVDADYVAPAGLGLWTIGSKVGVTVRGLVPLAQLTETLRSYGGGILYRTGTYNAIDAVIPITMLHNLAIDPVVASVNPISPVQVSNQGAAGNQANEAQVADLVRSTFGVSGLGVKIGVISDSVSQVGGGVPGSIASGDLPASGVQIITDLTSVEGVATDEGRAMLELIHDVAPGAELAFATAFGGQQIFADAIRALRAAGCDIIVDDVGYFAEPFFQPGIIDQAITDVVADGAIYVTSAGNSSDSGYDVPITFTSAPAVQFVDWDSGPALDTKLRISLSNQSPATIPDFQVQWLVTLQWDNPYNGIAGNVSTDLDLYVFDPVVGTRIRASSTLNNLRTGVPIEQVLLPAGRADFQVRVAATVPGKALPTRIKFVAVPLNISAVPGSLFVEYPGTRGSIWGHSGHTDVISVGAVPFFNAPPYSGATPIFSEPFSSTGEVTRIFDANGNRLATPQIIQKPDISGIDGTNTSFFTGSNATPLPGEQDIPFDPDGHPNFFGTSAAAPNVAASLALVRQAAPGATLNEIVDILKDTATPINGTPAGTFDPQAGFGLINTFGAIEPFVAAPTVQQIIIAENPAFGALDQITIVFSQQVSGFTVSDLRLSFESDGINLLTGGQTLVTVDGGRTWILQNVDAVTSVETTDRVNGGTYLFEVFDSESDIVNPLGLQLQGGASTTFEVLLVPGVPEAPSGVATKAINQTTVRVRWVDNSLFEAGYQIERSESADFTSRVTRFTINQANVTVFTDSDPSLVGKKLYYRVRAFNPFNQFSEFSAPSTVTTPSSGEIILDNESSSGVTVTGTWDVSNEVSGFLGSSYLDDLNSGKGTNSVKFTPNIPFAGDYFVYVRWTRANDRATNVPMDVVHAGGKQTFIKNQRESGGAGWVLLGRFNFKAGGGGSVTIRTTGTNGKVIVDAVRFLSATGG